MCAAEPATAEFQRMPFLTIFTAPKSFSNPHIAMIQRNAIRSWQQLEEVEVYLVGEETGMAEAAEELGVIHLPQVCRNAQGTPLVSSIFEMARQRSQAPYLAYLNADILLMPDFILAVSQVAQQAERFLIVGQRWDLDVHHPLDFSQGWEVHLRQEVLQRGALHPPAGSDYFVFPRNLYQDMPDFAIGRAGWDNWTIFHAVSQGWAVVDVTPSAMVIHQSHDYSHLPGGEPHYNLDESIRNQEMAGGMAHMYMVLDTNHQLIQGKLRSPHPTLLRTIRRFEVFLMPEDRNGGARWWLARRVRRMRRSISGSL